MMLYQLVTADELNTWNYYTVHGENQLGYYVGQFVFLYKNENIAAFHHMKFVYYHGTLGNRPMVNRYYVEVKAKIFKRLVYNEEQRAKYRAAFEKRAVEQIISHVLGHRFFYF